MKNNILVISDGNGVDSDFKKWPFYLQLLMSKTATIINKSVIGAGNEIMFMQLADAVAAQKIDHAIVQWSMPSRLDVVIDDFWSKQATVDETYHFNIVSAAGKDWWVSSASKNPNVRDYHIKYIKHWQAVQRTQSLILAAAELLKHHNVNFVFSLCYALEFSGLTKQILDTYKWAWHQPYQGLSEFRNASAYKEFDLGLPRPHTLIQLEWINRVLLPSCNFVDYDQKTYYNIERTLINQCSK